MSEMDHVCELVSLALSDDNAIDEGQPGDDLNFRYRAHVSMAVVGTACGGSSGFAFRVAIPRQTNNDLARAVEWTAQSVDEAVEFLDRVRGLLRGL